MEEEYIGNRSTSFMSTIKQENGQYKVYELITHERTKDGEDWEKREVELTVYGEDMNKAMAQCMLTVNQYLESINYDLFSVEQLPQAFLS